MKALVLEKLKPNLEQILLLLYKFRYLNIEQIQILLNHKQKERIRTWLNYLTEEKYIKREYKKKIQEELAKFCLGTKGRKYFLKHRELKDINYADLDRVWKEDKYSKSFKKHCMFVGHIYISLLAFIEKGGLKKEDLRFLTKTDLKGVQHLIDPNPDAYFTIQQKDGVLTRYFLDVFDYYFEKDDMEKRVNKYINYFQDNTWQYYMKQDFPKIILVFPRAKTKGEFNKIIKEILEERGLDISFYLSTWGEILQLGINRSVLHKVEIM